MLVSCIWTFTPALSAAGREDKGEGSAPQNFEAYSERDTRGVYSPEF